ncbi:MAG TPA: hypothetical protein VJ483_04385 [Holophagaceae bacterium]|nr:hypothetical protein [Holophagaceae bacterium]
MKRLLPGLLIWAAALLLAFTLPGHVWRAAQPPPFPLHALLPWLATLGLLAASALLLAAAGGPALARGRALAVLEAPPGILWAGLLLALWPAAWGPPGPGGLALAFLAATLPSELRWLASALPPESPFPAAWGRAAMLRSRGVSVKRLAPRWLAARLALWLTTALVLECLLGLPGLGSDWMQRAVLRDHVGLSAWIAALALLWLLARPLEQERP